MQEPEPEQEEGLQPSAGFKASLERMFFKTYLKNKGLTEESLKGLPANEAKKIHREAAIYASMKMAEEENRARFVDDIHKPKPGI
jgi:hypothetical protein